jgi:hypothetical protein
MAILSSNNISADALREYYCNKLREETVTSETDLVIPDELVRETVVAKPSSRVDISIDKINEIRSSPIRKDLIKSILRR